MFRLLNVEGCRKEKHQIHEYVFGLRSHDVNATYMAGRREIGSLHFAGTLVRILPTDHQPLVGHRGAHQHAHVDEQRSLQ